MVRSAGASLLVVAALAAGLPAPRTARAADVAWTQIAVRDRGAADTVAASGRIAQAAGIAESAALYLRAGDYAETVPAASLRRTAKRIRYTAPKGAAGIRKFSMSLKTGQFTLEAGGFDVGDVAAPVAFTLDVGGRRVTGLHPLAGRGASRSWKRGSPVQAALVLRVVDVRRAAGSPVLAPAAGLDVTTSGGPGDPVSVVASDAAVGADGTLRVTTQIRAGEIGERVDLGSILGIGDDRTRPGSARVTAGDDGEFEAVVFVEQRSGAGQTMSPGTPTTLVADAASGGLPGAFVAPAGAVASALPGVTFTPYSLGVEMPAPLPPGYTAVAGAEIAAGRAAEFVAAAAPTMELGRPPWVGRDALAGADLRLLEFRDGAWSERPGRGTWSPGTDRIGPHPDDPARLGGTGAAVWAVRHDASAKSSRAASAPVRAAGRVVGADGEPVAGQVVLTRVDAMVSGADGGWDLGSAAVGADAMEIVQVLGDTTSAAVAVPAGAGGVDVRVPADAGPLLRFGRIAGTVTGAGGTVPVSGAAVTVRIATGARGLVLRDGGTPDVFADDEIAVPDVSDLGVSSFRWTVTIPGDPAVFESASTLSSVSPTGLLLEAQDAGRSPGPGVYTVTASYDVPVLGEVRLFAGFRVTVDGITPGVTDVQLPAAVEGIASATVETNASGAYALVLRAPAGVPMTATVASPSGDREWSESFFFRSDVALDLTLPADPDPAPPAGMLHGWNNLPDMDVARLNPRAAALGGRLWVAGGTGAVPTLSVYDPATREWTPRASATVARDGPGSNEWGLATDGSRLLAFGGSGLPRDVESYDPATNTWSVGTPMATGRAAPGVVTVGSSVWLCGGWLPLGTVEIFDLATRTWTSGPTMPRATQITAAGGAALAGSAIHVIGAPPYSTVLHHMALQLSTGLWSVLPAPPDELWQSAVVGMHGQVVAVGARVDVYDPVTQDWFHVTDVVPARAVGGTLVHDGILYVFGGANYHPGGVAERTVSAWRPPWIPRSPAPTARRDAAAAALNGRVYVAGGTSGGDSLAVLESYTPATDSWRGRAPMPTARSGAGLVALGGKLYAIGGSATSGQPLATVEAYTPALDSWVTLPPMAHARSGAAVCVAGGRIYVAGGGHASTEVFDPATGAWSARAPMPSPRSGAACGLVEGRIVVAGGTVGGTPVATVEAYDPVSNSWSTRPSLAVARGGAPGAASDSLLYVLGGEGGQALRGVEVFDATGGGWATGHELPRPRTGAAAAVVDGVVYVVGGADEAGTLLRTVVSHRPR